MNQQFTNILLAAIAVLLLCLVIRPATSPAIALSSQGSLVFVVAGGKLYEYQADSSVRSQPDSNGDQQVTNPLHLWGVSELKNEKPNIGN